MLLYYVGATSMVFFKDCVEIVRNLLTGRFISVFNSEWVAVQWPPSLVWWHFFIPVSLAKLKHFLYRSLLTTSFHLNFTLTQEVGPSTTKFIIFFVHNVSSWLLHMSTYLICYRSSLLLSSSAECCCFIFTPHIYWIIAWSLILVCDKAPVDMGHGSLT